MSQEVASNFSFKDFTVAHYSELLQKAKGLGYEFCSYTNYRDSNKPILWRHDVDFSVHRALKLAIIENELGAKSTFFLHLHSEYYNLLEKEVSLLVNEILKLGHDIGLHFDTHFYGINNEELLNEKIEFEAKILKEIFGVEIKAFSFHNTTPFTMNCNEEVYGGLINAYNKGLKEEFEYCSDSNGYWRFQRMMDVISSGNSNKLHILTHPEWWQDSVQSPWEKIQRCINERAKNNLKFYRNHLANYNMKNIDWNGEVANE